MKVSGTISDSYGLTDGANVVLYRNNTRTTLGVASNQDGYFEIDNEDIKPNDEFRISFVGLKTQMKKASELQDAQIYLEDNVEELDEVVITANIGKKPTMPTFKTNTKTWENKWYTKPTFLLSLIAVVTTGTIVYIIKKTR
jgi:hypothetical protein|tara:strand:- start:972 stop:1394 length:423 start_codon:yes stop_codon:yes gene_type:complete